MQKINNVTGESYNRTILKCMMYYPSIFPSESAVQQHLFLGYGTGYGWNHKGQLSYYLGWRSKDRPERSIASILGEKKDDPNCNRSRFAKKDRVCFYPCGGGVPLWTHDLSNDYSPVMYVLRGEVTPNNDWKDGLSSFCHAVLRPDLNAYRSFLLGYTKLVYPGIWEEWWPRHWENYMRVRDVASSLIGKWHAKK